MRGSKQLGGYKASCDGEDSLGDGHGRKDHSIDGILGGKLILIKPSHYLSGGNSWKLILQFFGKFKSVSVKREAYSKMSASKCITKVCVSCFTLLLSSPLFSQNLAKKIKFTFEDYNSLQVCYAYTLCAIVF